MILRILMRSVPSSTRHLPRNIHISAAKRVELPPIRFTRPAHLSQRRYYATEKSLADELIEEITEQYSTTQDEFEFAVEETEKNSVYAADDRAAAADELAKLKELYESAIKNSPEDVGKEITKRVGQRIREIDHAIQGLEKSAIEHD